MVNAASARISETQNAPEHLRQLAAQRWLYTRAKQWLTVLTIATVFVPVLLALASIWAPGLRPWTAIYSILIAALDVLLVEDLIKSTQRNAAAIQEEFDCAVLRIEKNPLLRSADVDADLVVSKAEKYRRAEGSFDALENWYPTTVDQLPLPLARILCQRTNLRWDGRLRTAYARGVLLVVTVLCVGMFVVGVCTDCTLEAFVLGALAPALPVVVWGVREYKRQIAAAAHAGTLKQHAESLWESVQDGSVDATDAAELSRQLQDEILRRRRENPMVFDWVYACLKGRFEQESGLGAEELIRQAAKAAADRA